MGAQRFDWDPRKYVEFGDFRSRPFFDLTSRIVADAPRAVVDLGCGPGNLTATLAQRWPTATVTGLDSSPAMIATASAAPQLNHNLSFAEADIRAWAPTAETDVVVSNAALQWVPGHCDVMSGWLAALHPGAWLAVQVPGNFSSPSHTLMRQLADSPRWAGRLGGVLRHDDAVAEPADYLRMMLDGGARADVWTTTYQQLLTGVDPVLNWVRGTGLRPVLDVLDEDERLEFEAEYSSLLDEAYPASAHGTIFPFRRIFMVGQKK